MVPGRHREPRKRTCAAQLAEALDGPDLSEAGTLDRRDALLEFRVAAGQFDAMHFGPRSRQRLDEPDEEVRIDAAIASDRKDDVSNLLLRGAAQQVDPEPLAQLDERRGAEGEQRLDRIEDEMIVEDAVAMGAREFPGDSELPHARQTAEDDDPYGVVLPTTHGYAVTLSFTPRLCRTLSTVS